MSKGDRRPGVIRLDAWTHFPWLHAGFSTREGGESAVFGESDLNLGWTASDPASTVAKNREHFVGEVTGSGNFELITVRQFHSNLIRFVGASDDGLTGHNGKAILRGDALVTDVPGRLLGVQTADCVPVLVADIRRRVVGAFHAGWRGALSRIVQRGIGDFVMRYGSRREDIVAAIGPCIGACCFGVGEEVRSAFESQFVYSNRLFSTVDSNPRDEIDRQLSPPRKSPVHEVTTPQIHLDLVHANRQQLLDAGVALVNITTVGECTSCSRVESGRRKYFSHRAERGFTGRMLSVIGVAPE